MTWRFGALLGGVLLVASCGGGKEGPKGRVDPLTTLEGICERWAEAACNSDVVRACNGSSATAEECTSGRNGQRSFCADLLKDRDEFDRDLAKACIETVRDAYKDSEITTEEREEVILLDSGPCADLRDSGVQGAGGSGGGSGKPTPKAAGARCEPYADICVDTAYCDPGVGYCVLKAAAGETCCTIDPLFLLPACEPRKPEIPCTPGTFCSEGVCVSLGREGADCETDDQCAKNFYCHATGVCRSLGEDRDACETDDECARGFFCSESFGQCRDFIVVGSQELCQHLGAG